MNNQFDNQFYQLKSEFISSTTQFYQHTQNIGSGNYTPHTHKLHLAHHVSELGEGTHNIFGVFEMMHQLSEQIKHIPKWVHLIQHPVALTLSGLIPILPLVSGIYIVYTQQKLIKQAQKIAKPLVGFTPRQQALFYDAMFLHLCKTFQLEIGNTLPTIKLSKKQLHFMNETTLGSASLKLWHSILLNIAITSLCEFKPKERVNTIAELINGWKNSLADLIKNVDTYSSSTMVKRYHKNDLTYANLVHEVLNKEQDNKTIQDYSQMKLPTPDANMPQFLRRSLSVLTPYHYKLDSILHSFGLFCHRGAKDLVHLRTMHGKVLMLMDKLKGVKLSPDEEKVCWQHFNNYLVNVSKLIRWNYGLLARMDGASSCPKIVNFTDNYIEIYSLELEVPAAQFQSAASFPKKRAYEHFNQRRASKGKGKEESPRNDENNQHQQDDGVQKEGRATEQKKKTTHQPHETEYKESGADSVKKSGNQQKLNERQREWQGDRRQEAKTNQSSTPGFSAQNGVTLFAPTVATTPIQGGGKLPAQQSSSSSSSSANLQAQAVSL